MGAPRSFYRMPKVYHKLDPNVPKDAVYVGRPTVWGNPYKIGAKRPGGIMDRDDVIACYRTWIYTQPLYQDAVKRHLKGKDLVCWCAPKACHADILLEIANENVDNNR
jgi:hypothetical protein